MLPIQPVVRCRVRLWTGLFVRLFFVFVFFFHQNWSPEEKNRFLLVENLRPFVSPWRPLQGVCPAPGSFENCRKLELQISFHPMFGTLKF